VNSDKKLKTNKKIHIHPATIIHFVICCTLYIHS